MKKFLILIVTAIALVSCDFLKDPIVLGYSKVELTDNGKFICRADSQLNCFVDSLLTLQEGKKSYIAPVVGENVTVFTFDVNDKIYFYQGVATSEDIKSVYFQGDTANRMINFVLILICIIIFGTVVVSKKNREHT
ncbi:MAG: hypothetical protein E7016_04110 [Alphaproteobacteria bacterium]|nr:hypothetical protein [Alphaproteobacteria bacterium]